VAAIWEAGWHEVHPGEVPGVLLTVRTSESFAARAAARVGDTLVAEVDGEVVGFVMTEDDEVDQVYVAPSGRGTGAAAALLGEAECRIRDAGHAFYERHGWVDEGLFTHEAPGPDGSIPVTAHRYVKRLALS
jgi:GNAT superfamily N-acetyltransferase